MLMGSKTGFTFAYTGIWNGFYLFYAFSHLQVDTIFYKFFQKKGSLHEVTFFLKDYVVL